jgi:hypothetical protein
MFNDESFEKKGLMAESFASDYEDAYDEMLDEMGAAVLSQYSVSRMLRETDPIAYDVGMNDYESSLLADHQDEGDDSPYENMFDDDEELTSEGQKMLKEMYDEMLDETGVESLLNNYDASRLLKETDPIAYRVGLSDYESSMEEEDRNVYRDMAMQRKGMMAETFDAESNVAYTVYGIDDMNDLNNMSYWMEGGYHHNKEDAIAEAKEWWDSRNTLPLDEGGGVVKVWVSKTVEEYGVVDEMEEIISYEAENFDAESSGLTRLPSDEPKFDPQKADRNKDGKISSWERTVGNKVAKGIREGRKTSSKGIDTFAEPFEDIGISKSYARLGVIAAGITALAFGVKKLRK